ncbi:hypothetical protein BDY19DRAFT_907788 [Irpex rosettiformis]|uniref:Uncharacterized protein n=1 Tax=Irpex rosettiformis TaxID=378272 RepID=A0ACB8TY33_9APHY|nr:hypothetical protein BDY19DRAFT_907788 [Irpex rosettiformis]
MYTWNTTIEDTSATLDFHPYSDGGVSNGWAPFFQDIGFWSGNPGVDSFGKDSVHITRFPGATVNFQFEGTAIYLYGTQNCSYSVTLDSQPALTSSDQSLLPDGMLFSKDGLSPSTHTLSLIANPVANSTEQLAFDKAVFTNIGINASGISPVLIDNQNLTSIQYTGNWTNQSFYNVPSDTSPAPYFETSHPKDAVSMSFTGGVAVAINGARDWGHWTYNVTLDGSVSPVHNASTWWLMGDTVLFYQSNLDPAKMHTVWLTNLGTPGDKLSLNYFTVYVPDGTGFNVSSSVSPSDGTGSSSSHSKTNVGVIVGPTIAGVVVLCGILIGLWFWLQGRPRSATSESAPPPEAGDVAPITRSSFDLSPFPRNVRPDIWVKGAEAGRSYPEMQIQVVSPVIPYQGKRQHPGTTPPSQHHAPAASTSSSSQYTSHTDPGQSELGSAEGEHSGSRSSVGSTTRLTSATTAISSVSQGVNVDQIIELIAQRIDPGADGGGGDGGGGNAAHDPTAPPPRYVG